MRDLNTVKYSINPYNVNRMTQAAGIAAIEDSGYYREKIDWIKAERAETTQKLRARGFTVLPSSANFVFAGSDRLSGAELYQQLKARGVLVRHFTKERIKDFCRISIGTREQMQILIASIEDILAQKGSVSQ